MPKQKARRINGVNLREHVASDHQHAIGESVYLHLSLLKMNNFFNLPQNSSSSGSGDANSGGTFGNASGGTSGGGTFGQASNTACEFT